MSEGADLSPPGLAALIADFIEALDLENVTLVGNDTGGALCQLVVTRHPERVGRLVLTPCDAYENFLPPAFRYLQALARSPAASGAVAQAMRIPADGARRWRSAGSRSAPIPADVLGAWTGPIIREPRSAATSVRCCAGSPSATRSRRRGACASSAGPTLLAWARRIGSSSRSSPSASPPTSRARASSGSRTARTFVSEDQPERLAALIARVRRA